MTDDFAPPARFHLRVLGRCELRDAAHATVSLQPKRFAILVFLCLDEGVLGVDRERVRAMFWPGLEAAAGRNALNQAVHGIRRVVGADVLVSEGPLLRVSRDVVSCDAWELRAALERGDRGRVKTLYVPPLVNGLTLDDAPAFGAWVEEQRAVLAQRVASLQAQKPALRRRPVMAVAAVALIAFAAPSLVGMFDPDTVSRRRLMATLRPVLETASNDAARTAFIEGETQFREGRYLEAIPRFETAILSDSTFAWAHYRLSRAGNWTGQWELTVSAAEAAVRHALRLDEPARLLIEAWALKLGGRVREAEALYQRVLAHDSLNLDAMGELTDLRFHWGTTLGQPATDTRADWERLLARDPANADASRHLLRVLAMLRDTSAFATAAQQLLARGPGSEAVREIELLRAYAFGNSVARVAAAHGIEPFGLPQRRAFVRAAAAAAPEHLETGEVLSPVVVYGHSFISSDPGEVIFRAQIMLAKARLARARSLLDSASYLGHRAHIARAATMMLPYGHTSRAELKATVNWLRDYTPPQADVLAALWRPYLHGVLAARLGSIAEAERSEAELNERAQVITHQAQSAFAARWARLIRAERQRVAGDHAAALDALGAPELPPDNRLPHVWSFPLAHERLLRAELLAALGRHAEAVTWFRTFPDPSAYDIDHVPAAAAGLVKSYRAMGLQTEAARAHEWLTALVGPRLAGELVAPE